LDRETGFGGTTFFEMTKIMITLSANRHESVGADCSRPRRSLLIPVSPNRPVSARQNRIHPSKIKLFGKTMLPVQRRQLCLAAFFLLVPVLSCRPVFAENNQGTISTAAPSVKDSPNSSTAATASPQLVGNVRTVELDLEKLRDIGLDLKHLLKDVSHLYDEVMIQPVTVITEPELIGDGILVNIPIKTVPIGPPAPPKKERVDLSMSEIRPIIQMMKKNVDDFVAGDLQFRLSDSVMTDLKADLNQWVSIVTDIAARESRLEKLTQGPTYDNYAIAGQATEIEKGVKTLEQTRRSIYKILRKEGKAIVKAARSNRS
jgi:hypothetical protein